MAGFPPPTAFAAGPLPLLEDSPPPLGPPPAAMLMPPTLILILGQSLLPDDAPGAPGGGATELPSFVFLFTPLPPPPGGWGAPDDEAAVAGRVSPPSTFFCFDHPESAPLDPPTLETDNLGLPSIMSLFSLSSLINLHGTASLLCPPLATFPSAATDLCSWEIDG